VITVSMFDGLYLHSGLLIFPLCMNKGHNGNENIWVPRFRVPDDAELNVPLENGACRIATSQISIICNNTRTV
jgi:hypothetical protein